MRSSSLGLRTRLILLVLVAVIPAFGLIGYTAITQRRHETSEVERNALGLVRLVTQEQGQLIAMTRQLLSSLSQLPVVRTPDTATACSRILAKLREPYPYYTNFGVATPNGRIFCSAVSLKHSVSIADRSYFRRTLEAREFAVGDYQIGRVTGIRAINFGYPVLDAGGHVQAVVFAGLNLSWVNRLLSGIELLSGSILSVVDSRGTILERQPDPGAWVGKSTEATPLVRAMLNHTQASTAEFDGVDGVTRLYAFAPLHSGPSGNVYVTVGIPKALALAAANKDLARDLALFALVAALALLAAWAGGDVFVLRRVQSLAVAARRLGKGDLSARTGLPHGNEELGELARTFDDMATALQRVNSALKTISAGNRTVVRAMDENALLAEMCRIIAEIGGYRFAWVGYADQDERRAVRAVAQSGFEGGLDALADVLGAITWDDTERGRGPAGTAIRTAHPYVARWLLTDPGFGPWREEARRRGYAACVAFPLPVEGRIIGALAIYASEPDAFDVPELELLGETAEDLAFGIAALRIRAQHEQANETIRRMAYSDALTGLPNHVYLEERLQRTIAEVPDRPLALLLLDIDRLREINDALGFHQGDRLIKDVGLRIAALLGKEEIVARMRGDEFAILLPGTDATHATTRVLKIISELEAPFALSDLSLSVSATVGVALFPQHGADAVHLVRHADVAMHQAKESGSQYVFYVPGRDEENPQRLALAGELRQAIDKDELVLYYQPKVDLRTGRICGAEALVRWPHPQRGMISPDEFIPLAEHTGLIKPLTDAVLAAALRQVSTWRSAGLHLPVAVNLSVRNLRDPGLLDRIEQLLAAWDAEPDWIEIEITESAMMEDPEGALEALTRLRELGIALFIDDFGTGHSSLGYLKRLPVHAVKIDKSFVSDMLLNTGSAAIVRSTITLAHDLGLKVVAEGVESPEIRDRLATLECDVAQGYLISKPLPSEQLEKWLGSRPRQS